MKNQTICRETCVSPAVFAETHAKNEKISGLLPLFLLYAVAAVSVTLCALMNAYVISAETTFLTLLCLAPAAVLLLVRVLSSRA